MVAKKAFQVRCRDVLDLAACGEIVHFSTFFADQEADSEVTAPKRPESGVSVISASAATTQDVVRYADAMGYTALHVAAVHGHFAVAKILLEHGADPNSRTDAGVTPLHAAAEYGHGRIVELLLVHGAEVNHYTTRYELALGLAMAGRHAHIVVRLEPLVNELSKSEDALVAAASGDMLYYLLKILNNDVSSFGMTSDAGDNAMHVLTKIGVLAEPHYAVAELIVSKKLIDVNAPNTSGLTPLMYATRTGNVRMITLLLKHGANPTISSDVNDPSRTALTYTSNDRIRVLLDEAERKWEFEEEYAKRNGIAFDARQNYVAAVVALRKRWEDAKVSHRVYCEDNRIEYVPL